jgi:hypothetical protein
VKKLLDLLTEEMGQAFAAAGYDAAFGKVGLSNRPDLCEFQCNGAMAGAKQFHKAPIMIANEVAAKLEGSKVFAEAAAVAPVSVAADTSAGVSAPEARLTSFRKVSAVPLASTNCSPSASAQHSPHSRLQPAMMLLLPAIPDLWYSGM